MADSPGKYELPPSVAIDPEGGYDAHHAAMTCPVCGTAWVHPVAVLVNPAGKLPGSVLVTEDGLHIDRTAKPDGRGVYVQLVFDCETGAHSFVYGLHFHKGMTYLKVDATDIPIDATGLFHTGCKTIWRD
jgi:hypothetical protein